METLLLLLTAAAHAIADASNSTDPRSFAVVRKTEVVTYEPFDYSYEGISPRPPEKGAEGHRTRLGPRCHNSTHCNTTRVVLTLLEETQNFLTGPLVTRFVPTVYVLVFLVSVPLNALAFVVFSCRIREKKPVVLYFSQLALADLLFGLVLPLKVHYYVRGSDWVFGEAMCRAVTAAFYGYMNCSVLLVMCMSVDRMLAVKFPMKSLNWRRPQNTARVCVGVWILGMGAAMPLLTIQQTLKIEQVGTTCHDVLDPADPRYLQIFVSISSLLVFVPLVVTVTCYGIFVHALMPKNSFQGGLVSPSLSVKRRKRAAVMVLAMSLEFVLCFLPTNVILLLHCALMTMDGKMASADQIYSAYIVALCLGSCSACVDPLLYYFGSSKCKEKICAILAWRKGKQAAEASSSSSTQQQYSQAYTMHTYLSSEERSWCFQVKKGDGSKC